MSLADDYKLVESLVLDGYRKNPDSNGRSQKWKIDAITEDRKAKNYDSNVMREFVQEIERKMDSLKSLSKTARQLLEKEGLPVSKSLIDSPQ